MNSIALKTAINLNSNTSTVLQQGMIKNNAPFYNNALSPFYKKNQVLEEGEVLINDTLTFNKLTGELKDSGEIVHTFTSDKLRITETTDENVLLFHKEGSTVYKITETENDFTIDINFEGVAYTYTEAKTNIVFTDILFTDVPVIQVGDTTGAIVTVSLYVLDSGGIIKRPAVIESVYTGGWTGKLTLRNNDSGIPYLFFVDINKKLFYTSDFSLGIRFTEVLEINTLSVAETYPTVPLFLNGFVAEAFNIEGGSIAQEDAGIYTERFGVNGTTLTVFPQVDVLLPAIPNRAENGDSYCGWVAKPLFIFDGNKNFSYSTADKKPIANGGYQTSSTIKNNDFIGSRVQLNDKFNVLVSNGVVSGISTSQENRMGVLISEWFAIDGTKAITFSDNAVSYTLSDGTKVLCEIVQDEFDYLVTNDTFVCVTNDVFCAYDIKNKKLIPFAIDYNNRISTGSTDTGDLFGNGDIKTGLFATSINPFPEVTKDKTLSIQTNASIITDFEFVDYSTTLNAPKFVFPESLNTTNEISIDIFENTDSQATSATYVLSFIFTIDQRIFFNNLLLKNLVYPTATDGNILLNYPITAKPIQSYSNSDIVLNAKTGYNALYINNSFIFAYYIFSGFFGLEGSFVLQGQRYVFNETMLFITDTTSGILTNTLPLVDISGYIFLGHNTKEALFFSESERAFFSFYGDRTLTKIADTDSITDIYNTYYNQNTQTIIVHSNRGFIFIREAESFIVSGEITDTMIVTETGFIINKDLEADFYSYFEVEGYEQEENDLQTCYMGLDEFTNTRYECWYMKFFSARRLSGTITFSEKAITDKNFEGKTKTLTVKESDWDSNNTLYVRYRPSIQNSVAVSIGVKCPFDIYSMAVKMGSSQEPVLSRFNV